MTVPTILLTGPTGSGKTTVAFEMSRQLEEADVAHALVDTDELDRIYPAPPEDFHKTLLTKRNLAAVWTNLRDAGAGRLILAMVAVPLEPELPHLTEAVPGAEIRAVRLRASEETLLERVRRRETGSGSEHHSGRAIEQSRLVGREDRHDGHLVIDTTSKTVTEVAHEVLWRTGWLPAAMRRPGPGKPGRGRYGAPDSIPDGSRLLWATGRVGHSRARLERRKIPPAPAPYETMQPVFDAVLNVEEQTFFDIQVGGCVMVSGEGVARA